MSEEQINIAIAEACGWRQSERNIAHWHHVSEPYSHILTGDLPNYCNDLNAMHEAEETLDCNQWEVWHRIVGEWPTELARLTASQRAEAFLRTIGKWKESK